MYNGRTLSSRIVHCHYLQFVPQNLSLAIGDSVGAAVTGDRDGPRVPKEGISSVVFTNTVGEILGVSLRERVGSGDLHSDGIPKHAWCENNLTRREKTRD